MRHGLEADDGPLRPFVHIGGDGPQAVGGPGGPGLAPRPEPQHFPTPVRDESHTFPVQQFFGEQAPQAGPPLGSGSLLTQENAGSFVNLGNTGPELVSNQPSFSTFVDEKAFPNPLSPFDQGPGLVPQAAGFEGGRPFVNLGPGSGPGQIGPLGSDGPGHQGAFVDLGSPGGPADIFDNGNGGLVRSLSVGQNW